MSPGPGIKKPKFKSQLSTDKPADLSHPGLLSAPISAGVRMT